MKIRVLTCDADSLEASEPGSPPLEGEAAEADETSGISAGLVAGGAALLSLGGIALIRRSRSRAA